MIENILNDIINNLDKNVDKNSLKYFTDGVSGSTVFSLNDKYLVKTMDSLELKTQQIFLNYYNNIDEFVKLIYINESLGFVVFEYVNGKLFKYRNDVNIVDTLYSIVSKYKLYDSNYYGYLLEDEKTWYEFLQSETDYDIPELQNDNLVQEKLKKAMLSILEENTPKFLIHGDFGAHNFMIDNNDKLKVIDPMPVIGDRLYDFYFAIFSTVEIFKNLNLDYILNFFDEDITHKKNILTICLYIRMIRAYKYDREDFPIYLEWFRKL